MKSYFIGFVLSLSSMSCFAQQIPSYRMTPYNSNVFTKNDAFSDEFNDTAVDKKKWRTPYDDSFATWTFVSENVRQQNGILQLMMSYDRHTRKRGKKQIDLYFNSGMLRSIDKVGYGYYEARVKGSPVWPGTCSAFWMYTIPNESKKMAKQAPNTIIYNEIDAIALQQEPKSKDILSCNMHVWVFDDNLKTKRLMASQYPQLGKNEITIKDWNGEKSFHTYAVENRPDSVVFYIDNKRVAAKPNYFWHKDMHLILSLGLRTPFEKYANGARMTVPTTQEQAASSGFPCTMEVDYIRSWTRDYSKFPSSQIDYSDDVIQKITRNNQ